MSGHGHRTVSRWCSSPKSPSYPALFLRPAAAMASGPQLLPIVVNRATNKIDKGGAIVPDAMTDNLTIHVMAGREEIDEEDAAELVCAIHESEPPQEAAWMSIPIEMTPVSFVPAMATRRRDRIDAQAKKKAGSTRLSYIVALCVDRKAVYDVAAKAVAVINRSAELSNTVDTWDDVTLEDYDPDEGANGMWMKARIDRADLAKIKLPNSLCMLLKTADVTLSLAVKGKRISEDAAFQMLSGRVLKPVIKLKRPIALAPIKPVDFGSFTTESATVSAENVKISPKETELYKILAKFGLTETQQKEAVEMMKDPSSAPEKSEKMMAFLKQEAQKEWFIGEASIAEDVEDQLDEIDHRKRDAEDTEGGDTASRPTKQQRVDY